MNVKLKRLLLPLLRAAAKGAPPTFRMRSAASQALFLIGKPAPKKVSGRLRREQKRATHKEETAKIRQAVMERAERADQRCEAYGLHPPPTSVCVHNALRELDHWLSGNGRRRQQQSVQTTWLLCGNCHRLRTANRPSAAYWNTVFERHCAKYGYPFTPHIIHAEPAKAGGAP